jgi:CBS domain containing-hemolysin-like protein
MTFWYILGVAILIISAIFSILQMAFICSNKFKIELLSREEDRVGKRLSFLLSHPKRLLFAFYLAQAIGFLVFGISFYYISSVYLKSLASVLGSGDFFLVLQIGLGLCVFLLLAEFLPKIAALRYSDKILYRFSYILYIFDYFFSWIIRIIDKSNNLLAKKIFRFSVVPSITQVFFQEKQFWDSSVIVADAHNEIDARVFSNALDFNKIKAREFMAPRTEIIALPLSASIPETLALFIETEISRIIIYDGTLDNVKGFIHSKSLFQKPASISDILQPILLIPESMSAHSLLKAFNENRKSVAIVIDEFGGTAGLVTVEDVVEVVFGEIDDEYDTEQDEEEIERQIDDNCYLFSARLNVDYVNQKYYLNLPEGEYTTLGGLALFYAERIPQENDKIVIGNFVITVTEAIAHKVNTVKVEKINSLFNEAY